MKPVVSPYFLLFNGPDLSETYEKTVFFYTTNAAVYFLIEQVGSFLSGGDFVVMTTR